MYFNFFLCCPHIPQGEMEVEHTVRKKNHYFFNKTKLSRLKEVLPIHIEIYQITILMKVCQS